MIRVFELVTEIAPCDFEIEPGVLYPAAVEHIKECLAQNIRGDGVIKDVYFPQAQALPAEAFALALTPRGDVDAGDLETRAQALELARVWFTEMLHRAVGGDGTQMRLHILKDEAYRL